ncbi:branched-chain amino acid aminotransferase [Micromonospora sp. WMMD882]|uniref:branched-chain amino acid aminotransferase n=1 Tax=Micromonospora sp. WMMD882 TaxID=3015151 RepID=UPI00248CB298|nr:branched-chain amino acid aminotransferase [Micromonospora sp. WMMD882]WBB80955.1 branched-chain amino acid aminotransferase [Micromonospora sp. WMMD882]
MIETDTAARAPHVEHGAQFTDSLVTATWTPSVGWGPAGLGPLSHFAMHPGMIGLHYGQVVFEGLKAYRQADGSMAVFRPRENARRFQRSARRLAMPEVPEEMFLRAVEAVVAADGRHVPDDPDVSLYLRPLLFASEANLMLRPANEYTFMMMAFVAGGFFGGVVEPVRVWVSRSTARAFPGGTGDVKCAANYAGAFLAQREAQMQGCHQVVWLDAGQRRWVEELGGMNLFFVRGDGVDAEVLTPELTGTLLPGVTRDTLLTLASRLGYRAGTTRLTVEDWRRECAAGVITEVFACGTAAVVTPVGSVRDGDTGWTVGDGQPGPVTRRLRQALVDLHHGTAPDPDGWLHPVR